MKKFFTLLSMFFTVISSYATDYYSVNSATNPNAVASWNTLTNGLGSAPSNFTTAGDKFILQNGHSMTTTATWALGSIGNSSTLQISTGAITLISLSRIMQVLT